MSSTPQKTPLEKSLQSYRVYSAPSQMSWKQHYVDESFSSISLVECSLEERKQFSKRLQECQCTICSSIKSLAGEQKTLLDLVNIITCETYKGIPKLQRQVIYSTSNGERPVGKKAYELWNGLQIIDMDIKDAVIAKKLKKHLLQALNPCNWFMGVVLSSSGKGLHVYTKIAVPADSDLEKRKLLYLTNFRHKYSFVYIACMQVADSIGFTAETLQQWMDLAMFKPQQGAFIGYDADPAINTHFFEDFIYIGFDSIDSIGSPDIDWITHPDLRKIFQRWEFFEDTNEEAKIDVLDASDTRNVNDNKVHYKHAERWKLANTLVKLYGLEQGYKFLRKITSNHTSDKELRADCVTASRHNKDVDSWAISCLNNRHGFKIKVDVKNSEITQEELYVQMDSIQNPNNITSSLDYHEFYITKDQYLGNIVDEILGCLGQITLLEAGPGLGKTEMVKQIVSKGNKIMMVMPFTSTIKSKVEEEEDWYYSYGSRKPKLDVEKGLALTLDKFSHLEPMDIKAHGFSYVFIDESHLLFMSEYRNIMSRVVDMIRVLEVPVVLMSGTPTGELAFFHNITHILVRKEEIRKKELRVNIVDTNEEMFYHMCKEMASDIASGKRILYPSNCGTMFSKRVEAGVNYFLKIKQQCFRDINFQYYKKSQVGEEFMDDINFKKTIKDIDLLMCTSYLSVGVDILDKYDFVIYFGDLCTAAEADQWSNRLRSNDLYIKLYISKTDSDGSSRFINKYRPMNFRLDDEELKDMHSILRICNASIERSPLVNQYNPLVNSIVKANNYVMYNPVTQLYYIDETAYKICQFEHKYREFSQQLPVFLKGMQMYGYNITSKDLGITNIEGTDIFTNLKDCVKLANDDQFKWNTKMIDELLDLITYDRLNIYKDAMHGMYDIRKSPTWHEDLNKNIIYCKSVEMFEKVVPMFLSFSKHFDVPEVREIFNVCKRHGRYNFSALTRLRSLFNLINADKESRLDLPIKEFMDAVYELTEKGTIKKSEYHKFIQNFSVKYAMTESTESIIIARAMLTMKRINDIFDRLFKCLVNCTYPHKFEMKMERVEILWKTRTEKFGDSIEQTYILGGFIDNMIPVMEEDANTIVKTAKAQDIDALAESTNKMFENLSSNTDIPYDNEMDENVEAPF